jgi:hypothetical protein
MLSIGPELWRIAEQPGQAQGHLRADCPPLAKQLVERLARYAQRFSKAGHVSAKSGMPHEASSRDARTRCQADGFLRTSGRASVPQLLAATKSKIHALDLLRQDGLEGDVPPALIGD